MTVNQLLVGKEIRAVLFDAFGTLCEIRDKRWPFAKLAEAFGDRQLARIALMTQPMSLRDAVTQFALDNIDIKSLEADLQAEVESIALYSEVCDVLESLCVQGVKLAVISNLALPYRAPLLRLLPFPFDAYAWSFEVGALKPDPRIFAWTCDALAITPANCLMVGDSFHADYRGARDFGMNALHLKRAADSTQSVDAVTNLRALEAIDSIGPHHVLGRDAAL